MDGNEASRALVTIEQQEQRDGTPVTCRTRIAGKVARWMDLAAEGYRSLTVQ